MKWVTTMKLYEQINDLMKTSETFLISTLDKRGFPTTIVVSAPLNQRGFQRLEFYLNAQGETIDNIVRNKKGAICCYNEVTHQSLLFKGNFSTRLMDDDDAALLNDYQRQLDHEHGIIAVFETMTAKIHLAGETTSVIF